MKELPTFGLTVTITWHGRPGEPRVCSNVQGNAGTKYTITLDELRARKVLLQDYSGILVARLVQDLVRVAPSLATELSAALERWDTPPAPPTP